MSDMPIFTYRSDEYNCVDRFENNELLHQLPLRKSTTVNGFIKKVNMATLKRDRVSVSFGNDCVKMCKD